MIQVMNAATENLETARLALVAAMRKCGCSPSAAAVELGVATSDWANYSGWVVTGEQAERAAKWLATWATRSGLKALEYSYIGPALKSEPSAWRVEDGKWIVQFSRTSLGD